MLTQAATVAVLTHGAMGIFAAKVMSEGNSNLVPLLVAFAKGFLFGAPELILNVAKSYQPASSKSEDR